MPEHEARAVYDHEAEDGHATGRRRTVADWGVGEELFDRMPRRRFRPTDAHRRDAHRGGRFEPREVERDDWRRVGRDGPAEVERDEWRRVGRDEPGVVEPPAVERGELGPVERDEPRPVERDEPSALDVVEAGVRNLVEADEPVADGPGAVEAVPPPEGRRTVVIRGRGAEPAWTPRRRPPRTVGERVGPRPDRLAAWAVALGMLLILIAILTAHG